MEAPHTWPQLSAGVLRRIMALIYDLLLLLGISFGYGIIVMLLRKLFGADTMQAPQGLVALMILVGFTGYLCRILLLVLVKTRPNIGNEILALAITKSLMVVLLTGKPGVERCLLAPACLAAGGVGLWWCWIDRNGDSLQDRLTGTRTLLEPKK